ncbi:MAG TPA: hypothetical protein VMZ52_15055 [Bryobacteraceae bacterium]|nr:hypothetical protein [Bryobacteraceae bacterium]
MGLAARTLGALILVTSLRAQERAFDFTEALRASQERAMSEARARDEVYRRKLFCDRFNALVQALILFGDNYNQNRGMVLPAAKLAAIRKAWRELERTDVFGGKQ